MNNGFKRIATTILSKCTVNAYLAIKHGIPSNHVLKCLSIQEMMPILVSELLANQKPKATKYNAALNLSLLPQIATAAGVQGNQLPNMAARVFNVESNDDGVALIPTEINARQTRRSSLKSVEMLNKKVPAKTKRSRASQMEIGRAHV